MNIHCIFLIIIVLVGCNSRTNKTVSTDFTLETNKVDRPISSMSKDSITVQVKQDKKSRLDPICIDNHYFTLDSIMQYIDSTLEYFVKNSEVSYFYGNDLGRYKTINSKSKISSIEVYYSVAHKMRFTNIPYCRSAIILDTLNLLDSIYVPYFDNNHFGFTIPCEVCNNTSVLGFKDGQLGYFREDECINKKKVRKILDNNFSIAEGKNIVVQNLLNDSTFTIPVYGNLNPNFSWAPDQSKISYMAYYSDEESHHESYGKIFLFDLKNWKNIEIGLGGHPQFLDNNESFFYHQKTSKNSFKYYSLNNYNILNDSITVVYVLPDSLDLSAYGELYEYSTVKIDSLGNNQCYSVILYQGTYEEEIIKSYKLYLSKANKVIKLEEQ